MECLSRPKSLLASCRGGPWAECRADTPASWFEMEQEGLCCEGWEWVEVKQILGGVVFMSGSRRGEKRGRGWRNRGRRKEEDWVRGGALLRSFNMLGNW